MKIRTIIALTMGASQLHAQMPSSFDASGRSVSRAEDSQGANHVDGEPTNPQLLGMEIPLLDPASDTMAYNGSKIDVGNNAVVRARFEKYLQQVPDETEEAVRYRNRIKNILESTRTKSRDSRYIVGSETLIKIGNALYDVGDYDADGGQSLTLASAIASSLDAQRLNYARNQRNQQLGNEIQELKDKTNKVSNQNAMAQSNAAKRKMAHTPRNQALIAYNQKDIVTKTAEQVAGKAENTATTVAAKINYQSMMLGMLMQRRFDHVVIAARIYRHIFSDGDTQLKLDKNSDANKMFQDVAGMPPTVNTMDSLASAARRDADQSIQAVHNLLAQSKLADATNHLINAVAVGEYMHSVVTFPAASRMRIAKYWTLRKQAMTALNARDYGTAEEIAAEMKAMDVDFDDSMIRSYCSGKKRQSNLHLRNAMQAQLAGNHELFNKEVTQAGIIWPTNPRLDEAEEQLMDLDNKEPQKEEFKRLYARGDFRTIYEEQERFEVVAIDPELKAQYKEALTAVGELDAMLVQLEGVAQQDKRMGPAAAYEMLLAKQQEEPSYNKDMVFNRALAHYKTEAHDFVQALQDADDCMKRDEIGSALSAYYRAKVFHPSSRLAQKGIDEASSLILNANY